jgi:hypothetical protein
MDLPCTPIEREAIQIAVQRLSEGRHSPRRHQRISFGLIAIILCAALVVLLGISLFR